MPEGQDMEKPGPKTGEQASKLISKKIAALNDWRGAALAKMRGLIHEAVPEIVEEWKWMGTPVFSHDGDICTGEVYAKVVKLTFAKGAALADPTGLFNAGFGGNTRRAIDIAEGAEIDAAAFKALVQAATVHNTASRAAKSAKKPGS